MMFPLGESSGWPDNRISSWLLGSPFSHFISHSCVLNSPIKSEHSKSETPQPQPPKGRISSPDLFTCPLSIQDLAVSPQVCLVPSTTREWVIHLIISKFPDGCCWHVSHNHKTTRASQATILAPKGEFLWGLLITSMSPGKQSPRQSWQKAHCLQPKTYRHRKSKKEHLAP